MSKTAGSDLKRAKRKNDPLTKSVDTKTSCVAIAIADMIMYQGKGISKRKIVDRIIIDMTKIDILASSSFSKDSWVLLTII